MKIGTWIIKGAAKAAHERLAKLEEIGAPKIMIEGQQKYVEDLDNGILKIGGEESLLDEKFISAEQKKGRGGKVYYEINGEINFFPNAKYGMYIARK